MLLGAIGGSRIQNLIFDYEKEPLLCLYGTLNFRFFLDFKIIQLSRETMNFGSP